VLKAAYIPGQENKESRQTPGTALLQQVAAYAVPGAEEGPGREGQKACRQEKDRILQL